MFRKTHDTLVRRAYSVYYVSVNALSFDVIKPYKLWYARRFFRQMHKSIDAFRLGVTSAEAEQTRGKTDDSLDAFSIWCEPNHSTE
jgi:hypothetical protein